MANKSFDLDEAAPGENEYDLEPSSNQNENLDIGGDLNDVKMEGHDDGGPGQEGSADQFENVDNLFGDDMKQEDIEGSDNNQMM